MTSQRQISPNQRAELAATLQLRLAEFDRDRNTHLNGLTQVESARETLLQDADDACQRAGEHEVEGIVADIDLIEASEIQSALQRIHGAAYGLCINCQAAIPFDRLRLVPQTLRCAACQTLYERST
jgi:RNA polymerase-binding transcription factor DksA